MLDSPFNKRYQSICGSGVCNGQYKKTTLESYFFDNFWLTKTPTFKNMLSKKKYLMICIFLHFQDNNTANKKR